MQKLTRFALIIGALLTPTALLAADDVTDEDICLQLIQIAEKIMDGRQSGVSMGTMMEAAEKGSFTEEVKGLVLEAYKTPLYTVEKNREREVTEFGNKMGVACYERLLDS